MSRLRFFAFMLSAIAAFAQWPQFRGPGGAGVSEDANPPVEFGSGKNLLWSLALPEGHSSPCVSGGRIFITGVNRAEAKLEVIAVDREAGKVIWRKGLAPGKLERSHRVSNPAATTPVTDGKRIYVYFGSQGLAAYNWDGELAWETKLPLARPSFGTGASPVLAGDLLLINRDYGDNPELLAFRKDDGKPAWRAALPASTELGPRTSHATPVIWMDKVLLHRPGELAVYQLEDGSRRWWVRIGSQGTSTPAVAGDVAYVHAFTLAGDSIRMVPMPPFSQLLEKFDENGDGKINRKEFPGDFPIIRRPNIPLEQPGAHPGARAFFTVLDANEDGGVDEAELAGFPKRLAPLLSKRHGVTAIELSRDAEGDRTASSVLWKQSRNVPEVPSPLVYEGNAYAVMNGGILTCMKAVSGDVLYRGRVGALGPYYSSPVAAAGKVYAASSEGIVSVLKAGDQLEVLANNDLGEPVFATPAPVGDTLYIRSAKHLWAFQAHK